MSAPRDGFDRDLALQLRQRVGDNDQWTQLAKSAEVFADVLEAEEGSEHEGSEHEDAAWQQVLTPVAFSRRVTLSTGQRMNDKRISNLNELYHSEQDLLKEAQSWTLANFFGDGEESDTEQINSDEKLPGLQGIQPLTDGEQLLLLRAFETQMRE